MRFLVAAVAFVFCTAATAQSNEQGYPCLSKLCLNDVVGDDALAVRWTDYSREAQKVVSRGAGSAAAWVKSYVRGLSAEDETKLIAYVYLRRADQSLLTLLKEKTPTFCRSIPFEGTFRSESGHFTRVYFMPDDKGAIRVTSLERNFAGDRVARQQLVPQLKQEFPYLFQAPTLLVKPAPWGRGIASFTPDGALNFNLFVNNEGAEFSDGRLARQTGCRGGATIN